MAIGSPSDGQKPTPPHDLFEFSFDPNSAAESCSADDVFLAGKLLPFRPPGTSPRTKAETHSPKSHLSDRRRPDTKSRFFGDNLIADYQKLRKPARPPPKAQPRWHLFALGPAPAPAQMEMKDMRNRQRRRAPAAAAGPWKLLQSLSCKAVEVGLAPHVRSV